MKPESYEINEMINEIDEKLRELSDKFEEFEDKYDIGIGYGGLNGGITHIRWDIIDKLEHMHEQLYVDIE